MIPRSSWLLVLFSLSSLRLHAQDFVIAQNQTEERPAGLLALPEIFGEYPCESFEPKSLDLYATPSRAGAPFATIERSKAPAQPGDQGCYETSIVVRRRGDNSAERLPTDETGEEYVKAVVYEKKGNWFRIAIPHGSAWIERPGSSEFFSYPEELSSDSFLTYLRAGWDGSIWSSPGAGTGGPAPAAWRSLGKDDIPVRVIATQVVEGEKWVRIMFETELCATSLGNLPRLEGWLPAYRSSRNTSVWFYSRGC